MYITRRLYGKTNEEQIYMSLLMDTDPEIPGAESNFMYGSAATKTIKTNTVPQEFSYLFDAEAAETALDAVIDLAEKTVTGDPESWYKHYTIPKRSGGVRPIDDPKPELRKVHEEIEKILRRQFFALYHSAAYAYVRYRNTYKCIQQHQNSSYFLKTDFHDFFGSTSLATVMNILGVIWPFNTFMQDPARKAKLEKALSYAFLRGGLPQGTTLSPMLTNLIMIPFDYELTRVLGSGYVYTRYADDCLISCPGDFSHTKQYIIHHVILGLLFRLGYPYKLNSKKTRYGSIKGANWNLGYMLNADHKITIGHQAKRLFKADMYNFVKNFRGTLSKDWVKSFIGRWSYYSYIEPEFTKHVFDHTKGKFHIWWYDKNVMIKQALRYAN